MTTPPANASTALWIRVLVYLVASLTRNRAVRDLVPLAEQGLDTLEGAAAATAKAERALVGAAALRDAADAELDEVVNEAEGRLYLAVGKNRKSPAYQKAFPNGLVAVTGAPPADEIRLVKVLEDTFKRDLADQPFVADVLPRLTAAREELERQLPLHQAALDAVATAWAAELAARHDARRQYRVIYAELVKRYPDSLRKVNAFFRDIGAPRRPVAAEEVDEAAEAPTEG